MISPGALRGVRPGLVRLFLCFFHFVLIVLRLFCDCFEADSGLFWHAAAKTAPTVSSQKLMISHFKTTWWGMIFLLYFCLYPKWRVVGDYGGGRPASAEGQFPIEESWFSIEESWFPIEESWFTIEESWFTIWGILISNWKTLIL